MNKHTRVAFFTLIVSVVVLLLKTQAYYATLSLAVMSDALETVINVVTALVALFAVKVAAEPADENHPYGHGKLEYFSASFEGGLVFFAGLAVIYQGVLSFFRDTRTIDAFNGNIYLFAATALNLGLGLYLIRYGKKSNSETLSASGQHIMSDVVTTAGVFGGLVLVKVTGLVWIDSVVALIAGGYLLWEASKILNNTASALMDGVDEDSLKLLAEVMDKHKIPEVIDIHNARMIRSGSFHHIDAHVVVPEYMDVATVHRLTHDFEMKIVKDYKYDGEIAFHIDPCKRSFCKQCHLTACQLREANFEQDKKITSLNMIKGPQYTNQYV